MSPAQSNDIDSWYTVLDEIRADGMTPVKCTSPLCFFTLVGRRTTLLAENLVPIPNISYVYRADNKFYLRKSRAWSLDEIYFYRKTLTFSGDDEAMEQLRHRIRMGEVWLLFTKDHIEDMSAMLTRLYSSYWTGEGKVPYKVYLNLLQCSLELQEYKNTCYSMDGYRTGLKLRETEITELWKKAKAEQK